jgi:hypothetical protein
MDDYLSKALVKKVKGGVYLDETFYLKLRIWLMSKRPRIPFSEYAELAIREKYDRDMAQEAKGDNLIVAKR